MSDDSESDDSDKSDGPTTPRTTPTSLISPTKAPVPKRFSRSFAYLNRRLEHLRSAGEPVLQIQIHDELVRAGLCRGVANDRSSRVDEV